MSEPEEFKREIGDGRAIWLVPQLLNNWLVCIGPIDWPVYDDQWQYQGSSAALLAFATWDGSGEPDGWYRHPRTGRRRPDGDPSKEYIHF